MANDILFDSAVEAMTTRLGVDGASDVTLSGQGRQMLCYATSAAVGSAVRSQLRLENCPLGFAPACRAGDWRVPGGELPRPLLMEQVSPGMGGEGRAVRPGRVRPQSCGAG